MSNGWATGCKVVAWIALIGGIIAGIIVAIETGLWWAAIAGIGSSLITFLLFGTLGQISDRINYLESVLDSEEGHEETEEDESERQSKLTELYKQGSITEEEYMNEMFKDSNDTQSDESDDQKWSGRLQ